MTYIDGSDLTSLRLYNQVNILQATSIISIDNLSTKRTGGSTVKKRALLTLREVIVFRANHMEEMTRRLVINQTKSQSHRYE